MRIVLTTTGRILALMTCLMTGAPHAQSTVSLVWTATTGSGAPGSTDIEAVVGDVLTLDVVVNIDAAGLTVVSTSLVYDSDDLTGASAVDCPSPPNLAPGLCSTSDLVFFSPLIPGVTISNAGAGATMEQFDTARLPGAAITPQSMTIGRATFTVTDAGGSAVSAFFQPSIDGILDDASVFSVPPSVSATVNGGPPVNATFEISGPNVPGVGNVYTMLAVTATTRTRQRLTWATLMQRVFAADVLECPRCHGRMRVIAAIRAPATVRAILDCLDLPARAPPNEPPRPAAEPLLPGAVD